MVAGAIVICLLGICLIASHIRLGAYRARLRELQFEHNQLPNLERARELEKKMLVLEERREVLAELEGTRLPWPALLREIRGLDLQGITLRRISFAADGGVVLEGRVTGLPALATFLSKLTALPSLATVDLNYLQVDKEGGWTFDIQGWVRTGGKGRC